MNVLICCVLPCVQSCLYPVSCVHLRFQTVQFWTHDTPLVRSFRSGHIDLRSFISTWVSLPRLKRFFHLLKHNVDLIINTAISFPIENSSNAHCDYIEGQLNNCESRSRTWRGEFWLCQRLLLPCPPRPDIFRRGPAGFAGWSYIRSWL